MISFKLRYLFVILIFLVTGCAQIITKSLGIEPCDYPWSLRDGAKSVVIVDEPKRIRSCKFIEDFQLEKCTSIWEKNEGYLDFFRNRAAMVEATHVLVDPEEKYNLNGKIYSCQ